MTMSKMMKSTKRMRNMKRTTTTTKMTTMTTTTLRRMIQMRSLQSNPVQVLVLTAVAIVEPHRMGKLLTAMDSLIGIV